MSVTCDQSTSTCAQHTVGSCRDTVAVVPHDGVHCLDRVWQPPFEQEAVKRRLLNLLIYDWHSQLCPVWFGKDSGQDGVTVTVGREDAHLLLLLLDHLHQGDHSTSPGELVGSILGIRLFRSTWIGIKICGIVLTVNQEERGVNVFPVSAEDSTFMIQFRGVDTASWLLHAGLISFLAPEEVLQLQGIVILTLALISFSPNPPRNEVWRIKDASYICSRVHCMESITKIFRIKMNESMAILMSINQPDIVTVVTNSSSSSSRPYQHQWICLVDAKCWDQVLECWGQDVLPLEMEISSETWRLSCSYKEEKWKIWWLVWYYLKSRHCYKSGWKPWSNQQMDCHLSYWTRFLHWTPEQSSLMWCRTLCQQNFPSI